MISAALLSITTNILRVAIWETNSTLQSICCTTKGTRNGCYYGTWVGWWYGQESISMATNECTFLSVTLPYWGILYCVHPSNPSPLNRNQKCVSICVVLSCTIACIGIQAAITRIDLNVNRESNQLQPMCSLSACVITCYRLHFRKCSSECLEYIYQELIRYAPTSGKRTKVHMDINIVCSLRWMHYN